jgi:hypothetical protein
MNMLAVRFETEAELRQFFASCGLSEDTIERAVMVRYHTPPEAQYIDGRGKGAKKIVVPSGKSKVRSRK